MRDNFFFSISLIIFSISPESIKQILQFFNRTLNAFNMDPLVNIISSFTLYQLIYFDCEKSLWLILTQSKPFLELTST